MSNDRSTHPFPFDHFVGFDWAKDHHDVVLVDKTGRIVKQFRFQDSAEGWNKFRESLASLDRVAVAVETSFGSTVERLLALDVTVFPVQPKAAQRYRDRKAPSGVKTDWLDAWSLADALRTDGQGWRSLRPQDPLLAELRLLCRDEIALIQNRTALVNQLQQALHEYFPAALEAFDDWTLSPSWHFIVRFPTPQKLQQAGRRRWESFLKKHKIARSQTFERRLEIFARATQFQGSVPMTAAKSRLAVTVAQQLLTLQEQLDDYRKRITELFEQHPDHDLFGSLPAAAAKIAPRLLAEIGDDREVFEDAQSLQAYAGTAPISLQSGKWHKVRFRRACNKTLRATIHLWSNLSRTKCAWADAYYRQKRSEGKSHACALRCLGQRWIKILWKMWQTHAPYDEALHTRNQTKHGSWILKLAND